MSKDKSVLNYLHMLGDRVSCSPTPLLTSLCFSQELVTYLQQERPDINDPKLYKEVSVSIQVMEMVGEQ